MENRLTRMFDISIYGTTVILLTTAKTKAFKA